MLENAHFWSFYSTWFPAFSFHFILQGTIKQCPGKTLPQSSIRKFEQVEVCRKTSRELSIATVYSERRLYSRFIEIAAGQNVLY